MLDWSQYFAGTGTGFVGNTGLRPRQHRQRRLLRRADGELRRPSRSHRLDRPGPQPREGGLLPLARRLQLLRREDRSPRPSSTACRCTASARLRPRWGRPTPSPAPLPDPGERRGELDEPRARACSPRFAGTSVQSAGFDVTPTFSGPVTGQHGSYYTNAGQVQAPNYRPLQPYVTLSASRTNQIAHGVVIDSLASEDHTGFNPDNVRPTLDLTANEPEPQFTDQAWPTKVPTLVSLSRPEQTSAAAQPDDRAVLHLDSRRHADRAALEADRRPGHLFGERGLRATDGRPDRRLPQRRHRGVQRASSAIAPKPVESAPSRSPRSSMTSTTAATWKSVQLVQDGTGAWSGGAPFTGTHVQFFAEVCDAAGNCGYSSNKGRYFDAVPLPTTTGSITLTPSGTLGTGGWYTDQRQRHRHQLDPGRDHHRERGRRPVRTDPGRRDHAHRRRRPHPPGAGLRTAPRRPPSS